MVTRLLLVMAGGAIGCGFRFAASMLLPITTASFPWATLVINLVGSLFLGILTGTLSHSNAFHRNLYLFLGTGLCGGFTTMSAFSVEAIALYESSRFLVCGSYVVASTLGCISLAALGLFLARALQ